MHDVILHCFNWKFEEVADQAKAIADCGYGGVLLPPPLYSDEQNPEWWQRYQPKDYRIVRSFLGGKKDLEKAITALHENGVKVYIDIVFNHMANEKGQRPDPYNFPGEAELNKYRDNRVDFERDKLYGNLDDGLFCHLDFNPFGDISNWDCIYQSQEYSLSGLPDLDLNDWVVDQQLACLRAFNRMNVDGYRIDAIKHLPIDHIRRVFQTGELSGKYVFAEALTCNDNQECIFLWPLLGQTNIAFYDFPLHETLRRVFSPTGNMRELVNPSAYGQALPIFRALTFSVTHDIPYNDGFRSQMLNTQDEFLANIYMMSRDGGVPLVFSDHNESAGKFPSDKDRWHNAWNRHDTCRMIQFHNAVHGTPQRPLFEADGFMVFARGDRGIVAINKTENWQHPRIWTYGLKQGRYKCQMHGYEMDVRGQFFQFDIPPRQGQMWLCQEG